jgi:predicted dehydrogenase
MVVGQIGCGEWGAHVLRDLHTLGCDVWVVARSDASRARAAQGGAEAVVPEVGSLAGVDAIVVVTPIATHADVLDEALQHDVPVFVEKPLCDDPADADRLAALAPGRLFVMDKWRYHPAILKLAEIAESGSLGRPRGVRTIRIQPDNRHEEDATWVLTPHDLAIALEILGEVPRPKAAVGVWDGERLVTLFGVLEAGRGWHVTEISERADRVERRVELHCDQGVAMLEGAWDEHVVIHALDGGSERLEAPGELPLLAELRAFLAHAAGGAPPKSTVAEGAAAVHAIADLRSLAS